MSEYDASPLAREREEAAARLVELGLEERVGGLEPPDLRHRILAASADARREAEERSDRAAREAAGGGPVRRLLSAHWLGAAALVLLGIGVPLYLLARTPEDSEGGLIQPATVAEYVAALEQVRTVRVQSLRTEQHGVDLADEPSARAVLETGSADVLLAAARAETPQPLESLAWPWSHRFELVLADETYLEISLAPYQRGRVHVRGLGDLTAGTRLRQAMQGVALRVEREARKAQGIVFSAEELAADFGIPADRTSLRLFGVSDRNLDPLAELGRFSRLEALDLSGCAESFSGAGLMIVAKLPKLDILSYRGGTLDAQSFEKLGWLLRVEELDLSGCRMQTQAKVAGKKVLPKESGRAFRSGMKGLIAQQRLRRLDLSYSSLVDDDLCAVLGASRSLHELDLRGVAMVSPAGRLGPEGLGALGSIVSLQEVLLDGSRVPMDAVLAAWSGMLGLQSLGLSETDVSRAGLAALAKLPGLRRLDLRRCRSLDRGVGKELARYRVLEQLDLADSVLSGGEVASMAPLGGKLRRLSLRGVDLSGVPPKKLSYLGAIADLELGFTSLTDDQLRAIAASGSGLRRLALVDCDGLTPDGLRALASCAELERVDLRLADGLADLDRADLERILPTCRWVR